ncbi:MAG TPA: hypothetical protein VK670_15260 [Silvibacterium sp.]|nr:hypothetical protein [Silvibacterium sp.]
MKSRIRQWILPIIVLAILLAFTPHALYRVIKTGDPYLFTNAFFGDMLARLHGPGRLRFILQPTVAILLGIRDGRKDGRAGAVPFLWGVIFHKEIRTQLLKQMFTAIRNIVAIAILLDLISQYLIFRMVRPGAALILGPILIALPYSCARALANRLGRRRGVGPAASPAS